MPHARRHGSDGPPGPRTPVFGSYTMRMMASLAASLLLVVLCFRLPLDVPPDLVGWRLAPHVREPMLQLVDVKLKPPDEGGGVLVTTIGINEEQVETGEDEAQSEEKQEGETEPLPTPAGHVIEKMKAQPVLDFAEQMPEIVGGMRAYYSVLQDLIVYPPEAIAAGIQGLMVMSFIVEVDGTPTDIQVIRSLHPLCDSAAVKALPMVRFIPARQNGEIVRLRMRLPVRFKLVDPASPDSTKTGEAAARSTERQEVVLDL